MITTLEQLRLTAIARGPARLVIAGDSNSSLKAAREAESLGIARVVAVTQTAEDAAQLASANECDVVLKGSVRTDQLLHAILDRKYELRTDRLLSDVLVYEDKLSGTTRLVGITDGGVNVQPSADMLQQIVENALQVFHAIGFELPRVAVLSAIEIVSDAVPSTLACRQVANAVYSRPCAVSGPLALDVALSPDSAALKGAADDVAGQADILVAPTIEAGNMLGKAVKYIGGSSCAHVIVGARIPVLIPSRAESAEDKLNSIALGVCVYSR